MSVRSRPLCAYCSTIDGVAIDPRNVKIDFDSRGVPHAARFVGKHGVVVDGKTNLHDSFMHMSDTSNVYGHIDWREVAAWTGYIGAALNQNPHLHTVELHMYCDFDKLPYYAEMSRGDSMAEFFEMPSGHILYSKVTLNSDVNVVVVFDGDAYVSKMKDRAFREALESVAISASISYTIPSNAK